MVKKRNRFKQTISLEDRLLQFTEDLRQQAKQAPAGAEKTELMRRLRTGESALRIDAMLKAKTFAFTELTGRVRIPPSPHFKGGRPGPGVSRTCYPVKSKTASRRQRSPGVAGPASAFVIASS